MVMMQDGFTPLLASSEQGHVGVVEVLLKNRANIEGASPVGVRGVVVRVEDDVWVADDDTVCVCVFVCVFFRAYVDVCIVVFVHSGVLKTCVCSYRHTHTHTHISTQEKGTSFVWHTTYTSHTYDT